MRIEKDFLGNVEIPENVLYGIHAIRAKNNFPCTIRFHKEWYKSIGLVKKACYLTYQKFNDAVQRHYKTQKIEIRKIKKEVIEFMIISADEVSKGKYFDDFIIPALQGGAGTSINMNINEIIANATLIKLGKKTGNYNYVHPIEDANIFQSTNDVIPTALKVTVMQLLNRLESSVNKLRKLIESKEQIHQNDLRTGYTQLQAAVPTSFGKLFSAYNDALSRDWWRISKCSERIKQVNLGGSAIGTSITVPLFFVMEVTKTLQHISQLPITRSENLTDATQNLDSFVEIHGILKAHAVNLSKIANDLRLLSADIGTKEIAIPPRQAGSSIMPGKVNPVIPEYIVSASQKIYANDTLLTQLCEKGNLELNAYIPLIGHTIIETLKLLIGMNKTMEENLITGLKIIKKTALENMLKNPSITTALLHILGYQKASVLAKTMKENNWNIFEANQALKFLPE
ncbi:MAG TPA: aspartate ammonia-lyase, partial [Bacteroidales bacterium]|nr:aspartate ammonia-lyase [Bacteroidales bacterium]